MDDKLVSVSLALVLFVIGCSQEPRSNSQPQRVHPPRSADQQIFSAPSASLANAATENHVPEYAQFLINDVLTDKRLEAARAAVPFTEIQLERKECFGTCPSYIVTLRSDGRAEYEGRNNVSRLGKHSSEIDIRNYVRFCWAIEKFKLLVGPRSFHADWTDADTVILRITRRGNDAPIEILDYGRQGTIELWSIHNAIDGVAATIEWQPAAK